MIKSAYRYFRGSKLVSSVYKKLTPEKMRITLYRSLSGEYRPAIKKVVPAANVKSELSAATYVLGKKKPLVSIVVTAFNDAEYLDMCLRSVEAQSYQNFECIIVDDVSTDGSARIAKNFVGRDSRFSLITHKANAGLPAARNTGVLASQGEFVCFLDGDDYIYKNSIVERVLPLIKIQDDTVAGSWCRWDPVPYFSDSIPDIRPVPVSMNEVDFISAAGDCPFIATSPLIRREVFDMVGGFDETLSQAEDWDFWQRIMRLGYRFVPSKYFAVAYRQKRKSMMRDGIVDHFNTSKSLLERAYVCPGDESGAGFYKSWTHYKQLSLLAKRVVASLTIAVYNDQDAQNIVNQFDEHDWGFLLSRVDLSQEIRTGIIRAQGLTGADLRAEQTQIDKLARRVEVAIVGMLPKPFGIVAAEEVDLYDVIFIPHKDYHVVSLEGLKSELEYLGARVGVLDITYAYRDEGVRRAAKQFGIDLIPYNYYLIGTVKASKLVCFNDWDTNVVRPLIEQGKQIGIDTYGIVEGVQDFTDADTGRTRKPYKTVENVLLAGEYDYQFFDGSKQGLFCFGVPRLKSLLQEPVQWPKDPLVVINMNFSYGVLTDCAEKWLESVVAACSELNVNYVISRHPADKTVVDQRYVSNKSMYDLIRESTVFVSRFGSGILEALAMGKYAIYHNPHDEKVIKFSDAETPLPVTTCAKSLMVELNKVISDAGRANVREEFHEYLDLHCNIANLEGMNKDGAKFIMQQSPRLENLQKFEFESA